MHKEIVNGVEYKVVGNRKPLNNNPSRLRDLPPEEREPFKAYLYLKNCPVVDGEEQDGYWPADYRRWEAGLLEIQRLTKHYPRIRNLPQEEQEPFRQWLMGQTRPGPSLPPEEYDFFYQSDYDRWKTGLTAAD